MVYLWEFISVSDTLAGMVNTDCSRQHGEQLKDVGRIAWTLAHVC